MENSSLSVNSSSNLEKKFSALEKKLDAKFKNKDLLIQAFCHRSYLNENPGFYLFHPY